MIRIRVDDFPQTKGEPQHTLQAFRDFDRCLREITGGKRYLLGVIPGRCTVEDILFLRNETDCVIGLHGIDHDERKLDIYQNEFPPFLGQNDIGRKLVEAAHALDEGIGRETRIYMPPRNRIDARTIGVLLDAGFFAYTTGPETPRECRENDVLEVYHSEPPHEYGRTDEMYQRQSYRDLNERAQQGHDVILTLHWTWETNIGLDHMRKFFEQIHKPHLEHFDV